MRAIVTGGAGFIGSHLARRLLDDGHQVRVVDNLNDYYDVGQKLENLDRLGDRAEIVRADLRTDDLRPLVGDRDVVFHQAGQPGVRLSWAEGFATYESCNILATQRLLEACRDTPLHRFVFASSSSVYGDAQHYPTHEDDLPRPRSPYGVTKLAGEHLCALYGQVWGIPTISLRYFTVYGPGQRPDMAFHRMCVAALGGDPFPRYGDGSQIREFTYVDDVVAANLAAVEPDLAPGQVFNISGGASASLAQVMALMEELTGQRLRVDEQSAKAGDAVRTGGAIRRAGDQLGWSPATDLRTGLTRQLDWHRQRRSEASASAVDHAG
jgi:UDP-glucuronate 4-epimerase